MGILNSTKIPLPPSYTQDRKLRNMILVAPACDNGHKDMSAVQKNPSSVTHCYKHGKKIIIFKISQELIKHLQDEEEEYDNKYTDYCENVTTNDGQDGGALLAKYFEILDQFNKILEIEQEKQAEQKEKRNNNKSNNMFHNIINRQLGNANAMTRLKGQGQLIHLAKSIQEIGIGQLSEHLKHIHELNEAMEVVHDTLSDVWTYSLNHHHLLQIADVFECCLISIS